MSVTVIRNIVAGSIALAIASFGVNGSAELPPGLDKKAVAEAFESISLDSCKKPKGPTGEGHVLVTLAPTGKATSAIVDSPPFANTKVGKCIAKAYEKVRVPAFKGDAVTLGKKFKLE